MLRWIGWISTFVVVAGLAFMAGGFYQLVEGTRKLPVPLTEDLPSSFANANQAFDARIKSAFPLGSPVADLVKTLRSQGFVRSDWSDSVVDEHSAYRDENTFACNISADVYWRHDTQNRLTEVRGDYGERGCL